MTIGEATERYLDEILPTSPSDEARRTQRLHMAEVERYFGADTLLTSITQATISEAANRRGKQPLTRWKRVTPFVRKRDRTPLTPEAVYELAPLAQMPTPGCVNRQLIEPLRRVLRRAKKQWGVMIDLDQFTWGGRDGVKRKEPDERNRELSLKEELRFWAALPKGYHDICELFIISGKRQSIWLGLEKDKVDLEAEAITFRLLKKRSVQIVTQRLTQREFAIVKKAYAESPADCPFIFTIESERNFEHGAIRAISAQMLRRAVTAACAKAGIEDFHPHDFRHTFGSRLARATNNIKLVQKAMDHSNIKSTLRYVSVQQEEIVEARGRVQTARAPLRLVAAE